MQEIITNRKNATRFSQRPIVLVIYPKSDPTRAFKNNQIVKLMRAGYNVLYYEAATDEEVISIISKTGTATNKTGAANKISFLVLAGHGSSTSYAVDAYFSRKLSYWRRSCKRGR